MRRLLWVMLAAATAACSSSGSTTGVCATDSECAAPGTRCDVAAKRCVCKTDEACDDQEFCNSQGVCQARAGCSVNAECAEGSFCDIQSGQCLTAPAQQLSSACGLASHCAFGAVCSAGKCTAGCFDDGDCTLGEVCFDGVCNGSAGLCSTNEFCDYRERCDEGQCKNDRRGPYCRGCTQPTMLNPVPCDDPRNFCLINSLESGGFAQFCGVDCSLDQPCPNGYDCNGVVILTRDVCFNTAECQCRTPPVFATATCTVATVCDPRRPDGTPDPDGRCIYDRHPDCNGGVDGAATCVVSRNNTRGSCTCATDTQCGDGQACVGSLCCGNVLPGDRQCSFGENRVSGFCTCATDDDCPRDSCDVGRGFCAISGKPCTQGGNECGAIPCVDGGCLIGRNCAPIEGLSCSVVGGR